MVKHVRYVVIVLDLHPLATLLLLAMSVLFQCAALVMSMSGKTELSLAHSARLGIRGIKVSLLVVGCFCF
uniref:Cellulose synthase n=1 Tax=Rhizophora mucronata TaxID=61149 RepID=A0A2P2MNW3_RHIMU